MGVFELFNLEMGYGKDIRLVNKNKSGGVLQLGKHIVLVVL